MGNARFADAERFFSGLDAGSTANLVSATTDVVLITNNQGIILDLAYKSECSEHPFSRSWRGNLMSEYVTPESVGKCAELYAEMDSGTPARQFQINHLANDRISEFPFAYQVVPLPGGQGNVALFGRSLGAIEALQQRLLQAQFAVEREYSHSRVLIAKYLFLLESLSEAIIVADLETRRVLEVNRAARLALAVQGRPILQTEFGSLFSDDSATALEETIEAARTHGQATTGKLRLRSSDAATSATFAVIRKEGVAQILASLSAPTEHARSDPGQGDLEAVLAQFAEPLVIVDSKLVILAANRSFLDLTGLAAPVAVRGAPLSRFLGEHAVDLDVMTKTARTQGAVHGVPSVFRSAEGATVPVVLSVGHGALADLETFGLLVNRRVPKMSNGHAPPLAGPDQLRSVDELTRLVGRVPLRDIVRETTDIIEQMCVEAALKATGNNKATAAEMLGLSRQGLYSKIDRYGL